MNRPFSTFANHKTSYRNEKLAKKTKANVNLDWANMQTDYDIVLIGSGLGGYVTAIRVAQLDLFTFKLFLHCSIINMNTKN